MAFRFRRSLIALACSLSVASASAQRYFFENIGVPEGLPASKVYALLQDSTGLVWLGTEAGLASYDGNSVRTFGGAQHMARSGVRSLFLDDKQRLWAGHLGGGLSLGERSVFRKLDVPGAPLTRDITGIAEDGKGAIWVTTFGDGALRITDVPDNGPVKADRFGSAKGISAVDEINFAGD